MKTKININVANKIEIHTVTSQGKKSNIHHARIHFGFSLCYQYPTAWFFFSSSLDTAHNARDTVYILEYTYTDTDTNTRALSYSTYTVYDCCDAVADVTQCSNQCRVNRTPDRYISKQFTPKVNTRRLYNFY